MTWVGQPSRLDVSVRKDWSVVADGEGARVCVLTLKANDYGLFQLVWSDTTRAGQELASALISGEDLGRWGLVFRNPTTGAVIASGPITTVIRADGSTPGIARDAVSCWGVTDLTHLRERLIYPEPAVDIPVTDPAGPLHTWSVVERSLTGTPENLIRSLVDETLGAAALARRRLPGVTLTIPATAGIGDQASRTVVEPVNRNVLEACEGVASLGGLVFDLVNTSNGQLELVIREPQVRRGVVWSTHLGTALGVSVKRQRRPKTDVIAGGSGAAAPVDTPYARRVASSAVVGGNPTGGFAEVREEYIRASGDDPADITSRADEELVEDGPELGLSVEPAPTNPWAVGVDYEVGDETIALLGAGGTSPGQEIEVEVPLRQVLLRHDEGVLVEEPSTGFDVDDNLEPVIERIDRRLRRLEDAPDR